MKILERKDTKKNGLFIFWRRKFGRIVCDVFFLFDDLLFTVLGSRFVEE